jgi:hypothetical protein
VRSLLVVGSASGLYADLAAAQALCEDFEVMLVNGAGAAVEAAQHLLAGHTDKAEAFVAARDAAFPFAEPYKVHATFVDRKNAKPPTDHPSVTHWWPQSLYSSGATSAGKAARLGLAWGFDRVVLCGCPMDGSGYFPGESTGIPQLKACQRVGDPAKQQASTIRRYKQRMAELAKGEFKGRVFSMSGWTREVLGAPC